MKLSKPIQIHGGIIVPAGVKLDFNNGKAKFQGRDVERQFIPLDAIVGAKGPFMNACCATLINDNQRFQQEVKKTDFKDWAHAIVSGNNIIVYIWDTREVIDVIPGIQEHAEGGPRTKTLVGKQSGERITKIVGWDKWGWSKGMYEMFMNPKYHRPDNGLPLVTSNKDWQNAIAEINQQAIKAQAAFESCAAVEREFTPEQRQALADKGMAMPDGSYPIETVEDLNNAIQAYGRASEEDKEAVKAFIIKRAKELDALTELPAEWLIAEEAFFGSNGNGIFVLRYHQNSGWFKKLGFPEPQPWLHLGLVTWPKYYAVVFVWDTREVIAQAETDKQTVHGILEALSRTHSGADDNRQKLKGKGEAVDAANRFMR